MKELEQKEKIQISVKQQKQIEHQLLGKIVPHLNHRLFEINIKTMEITLASYSSTTYNAFSKNQREIVVKKDCVYISALNEKNALKKFLKNKNGSKL